MIHLQCACGAVRGELDPLPRGNHIVCCCDDCQAFAAFLGRDELLDRFGGTAVVQVAPAQVRVTAGAEHLALVRLSERGLHRWYASCCQTPIGNTMAGVPFIGVPVAFVTPGDREALGPPAAYVQGRFALTPPPERALATGRAILRSVVLLLRTWLTGSARPSPFFQDDGSPRVTPRVLTPDERRALTPPRPT